MNEGHLEQSVIVTKEVFGYQQLWLQVTGTQYDWIASYI